MMPSQESVIVRRRSPRILVRATNWIGDSVMSMPAVQRLRELEPEAHIALLCPVKVHDLWRHNPFVNEVIPFDPKPSIRILKEHNFDVAVIFPNSFRSAWEAWRAGIPCRVGFAGQWRRSLLTDVVPEPDGTKPQSKDMTVAGKTFKTKQYASVRHQVNDYLDIISLLGGNGAIVQPHVWLAPGELPSLTKFLHEDLRPFIGINAGAEYGPAKRWMADRFADAAARITEEIPCRWLLFGGPGDTEIANAIETKLRASLDDPSAIVNVAGRTTLMELCQLIKFCRLLLTNDTGPMHLADAVGTPVVAVFGSTSSELTGPLNKHSRVVREPVECSPCFLRECPIDFRCMNGVTVDRVVGTVLDLWPETEKARPRA
jgi:lipopolysaccharide heptosyltransferase II